MALNPVPQPSQSLAQTQSPILNNFALIDAGFSQDHVDFNIPNAGKHNQVTMPVQATTPIPSANDNIIYSKIPAAPFPLTGINETFIHKQNGSGANDIPFTASILSTFAAPGFMSDGWSYLPSGLLIKWGIATTGRNAQATQDFPTGAAIPAFTQVFIVIACQTFTGNSSGNFNTAVSTGNYTITGFDLYPRAIGLPGSGNVDVAYYAIGI